MSRKREADKLTTTTSNDNGSSSSSKQPRKRLQVGSYASPQQQEYEDVRSNSVRSDLLAPLRQGVVTASSQIKFLAQNNSSSGSGAGSGGARAGAEGAMDSSGSDVAPKNETQLERKRRLNRNNERKKRAKRILKIEDLTAQFHNMTHENEALKMESKELRERIALVKQYMKEQGNKKIPAGHNQDHMSIASSVAEPGHRSLQSDLLASDILTAASNSHPTTTSDGPHASSPRSTIITHRQAAVATSPPPLSPRLPSVASLPSSNAAAADAPSDYNNLVDLSFISREQRMRLLQQEFEKQEQIVRQLRMQIELNQSGFSPAQAASAPRASPRAPEAAAASSNSSLGLRSEEGLAEIVRTQIGAEQTGFSPQAASAASAEAHAPSNSSLDIQPSSSGINAGLAEIAYLLGLSTASVAPPPSWNPDILQQLQQELQWRQQQQHQQQNQQQHHRHQQHHQQHQQQQQQQYLASPPQATTLAACLGSSATTAAAANSDAGLVENFLAEHQLRLVMQAIEQQCRGR